MESSSSQEPDRTEGDVNQSTRRATWQQEHLDDETRALLERDAEVFFHQALSTPCLNALDGASGATLTDTQGRAILDFHGNSVHQVGYGHPKVIEAVKRQLDALPFSPRRYTNEPAIALAERLCDAAPIDNARALFAPGGVSAVGMALKLARIATGRHKTISWWGAFHGASLDAISVGGEDMFREGVGPLMPGAMHVPAPGSIHDGQVISADESADRIAEIMEREGDVAAFIAEPIRCTSVTQPPIEYWQRVRELCNSHGALLIFDEIPVCLGRTGRLFACEYAGIQPDILCIGKGLGGGVFPMAAMIARGDLNVAANSSIGHFTHEKSPVGAAAALATLDVIEEENLLERSRALGAQTLGRLREMQSRFDCIVDVRGVGLLLAVELQSSGDRPAHDLAEAVLYACLQRGLSFKISSGNILTLAPPLTITDEEMDKAFIILEESLEI